MTQVSIKPPRVPLVDLKTGLINPEWYRFLHDMWVRSGGADDAIEETQVGELYETGAVDSRLVELSKRVDGLELEQDQPVSSRLSALEKRIAALEVDIEGLERSAEIAALRARLEALENDVEMTYGT